MTALVVSVACSEQLGLSEGGEPPRGLPPGTGGSPTLPPVTPPEMELEESFLAPVVSGNALFTANPDTNQVARILVPSLEIEVVPGGHSPTYLAALPSGATSGGALVINRFSHDVSVLLQNEQGEVVGNARYPVQEGANAWTVGRTGSRALAWSRAETSAGQNADGFQVLTVFSFDDGEVSTVELSVGFRPSRVFVSDDESHAYVVSAPGLSVLDLEGGGAIEREIFLPSDSPNATRDVTVTPDGRLALVRFTGSRELLLLDTSSGNQKGLTLPGIITDLDLTEDGRWAFAVIRDGALDDAQGMGGALGMGGGMGGALPSGESLLVVMDTETLYEDPDYRTLVLADYVGSVVANATGSHALLYTNATPSSLLTIVDVEAGELRTVDLKAPVRAAFLSETGSFAVALMSPPVGSTKQGAFALVPIQDALPTRIEGTDQVPEFVTLAEESGRALITTRAAADGRAHTYFARFPELRVDKVALPSRPLASGVVPDAGRAFVAQEHPEGRVTFVDLGSGQETTLTGFELASKVVR